MKNPCELEQKLKLLPQVEIAGAMAEIAETPPK